MGLQETSALAIVFLTASAFAWSRWRPRKWSFQRETHCGCASRGQSASRQSIVFHARKGERPQVVVKMK
jgi:hypothetical protein